MKFSSYRKLSFLVLSIPLFICLLTVRLASADAGYYADFGAGYLFHEGDEVFRGSQLYEFTFGHDFNERWSLEGGVGFMPLLEARDLWGRYQPSGDANAVDLRVSGLYHLTDSVRGFDPFIKVTAGWDILNRAHKASGGSGDPFTGVGFGTFYNFKNDMFLRADYTFEPSVWTGKIHQMVLGSLGWHWGKGRARRLGLLDDSQAGAEVLERVYYAFDSAKLDQRAKETLQRNAQWMAQHQSARSVVEGHCDERGTAEYNLVLGQHRAESAYNYLRGLGVDARRMTTVSYGKERPADPGHNEAAWAKNRRAQFAVFGQSRGEIVFQIAD